MNVKGSSRNGSARSYRGSSGREGTRQRKPGDGRSSDLARVFVENVKRDPSLLEDLAETNPIIMDETGRVLTFDESTRDFLRSPKGHKSMIMAARRFMREGTVPPEMKEEYGRALAELEAEYNEKMARAEEVERGRNFLAEWLTDPWVADVRGIDTEDLEKYDRLRDSLIAEGILGDGPRSKGRVVFSDRFDFGKEKSERMKRLVGEANYYLTRLFPGFVPTRNLVVPMTPEEITEDRKKGGGHGRFEPPDTIKINPDMDFNAVFLNYVHESIHKVSPEAGENLTDFLTETVAFIMEAVRSNRFNR